MFAGKWQVHELSYPEVFFITTDMDFGFAAAGDCFFCSISQAKWQAPQLMHLSRSTIRMVSFSGSSLNSASCRFSVLLTQRTFILRNLSNQGDSPMINLHSFATESWQKTRFEGDYSRCTRLGFRFVSPILAPGPHFALRFPTYRPIFFTLNFREIPRFS